MSVSLYSCLSHPICKINHFTKYCIIICDLSGSTLFLNIISQTARHSKKSIANKICSYFVYKFV